MPSHKENGEEGLLITNADIRLWWSHYLSGGADPQDPYVSPLQAPDLSGLPPALVVTAEYDPLRDPGEEYARRLAKAGVPTELRRYDGQIHAFSSSRRPSRRPGNAWTTSPRRCARHSAPSACDPGAGPGAAVESAAMLTALRLAAHAPTSVVVGASGVMEPVVWAGDPSPSRQALLRRS
jgi:hypothetical protein